MAEHRDMIDDLIDIQSDWRAVSNPLGNIAGTLAANPEDVKVFDPSEYKGRPRANSLFCVRVAARDEAACSRCLDVCPVSAIAIEGSSVKVDDSCRKCGLCTSVCPRAWPVPMSSAMSPAPEPWDAFTGCPRTTRSSCRASAPCRPSCGSPC